MQNIYFVQSPLPSVCNAMCSLLLQMLKAHNCWTACWHTQDCPRSVNCMKGFSASTNDSQGPGKIFKISQIMSGWCMSPWCEKAGNDGWALVNWSSRDPTGCQLLTCWNTTRQTCLPLTTNRIHCSVLLWQQMEFTRTMASRLVIFLTAFLRKTHFSWSPLSGIISPQEVVCLSPGCPIVCLCPQNGSAFWLFDWSPTFTWP